MKWKELIEQFVENNPYMKPNAPATEQQIANVEERLNATLPVELKDLLREFNGDNWFVFSTFQIIEINELQRGLDFYMPLDCLLFFAGNGCGDYYGYSITLKDGVRDDRVFLWEHENDNRIWKANNLEDAIKKYYNNEI